MVKSTESEIDRLLEKAVDGKLEDYQVIKHSGKKLGESYLSDVITVTLKHRKTQKDTHLFVKLSNSNTKFVKSIYLQEIYFYNTILREFDIFQKAEIGTRIFKAAPKCLATDDESEITKLVLENVKMKGFQPFADRIFLDRPHMELVLKICGQFHGLSFAYKDKHPEKYSKIEHHVRNVSESYNGEFIAKGCHDRLKTIREWYSGPERQSVVKKLEIYAENAKDMKIEMDKYSGAHSVLVHGDWWVNNILVKYDEDKNPLDMMVVDYQTISMGSPIFDLAYIFYTAATKDLLDEFEHYLKIYYDSLSSTIKTLGSNPEKIYSFNAFKEEWNKYCKYGFIRAALTFCLKMLQDEKDAPETDDFVTGKAAIGNVKVKEEYFKTMEDLTWHMYTNNFL